MGKRFRLTDNTMVVDGVTLHQIEATEEFRIRNPRFTIVTPYITIMEGMKGGWVEKEDNLKDNAWLMSSAIVMGDKACVYGDAVVRRGIVEENAQVYGHAIIDQGHIAGNAEVFGNAVVGIDRAIDKNIDLCPVVKGNAKVFDSATVVVSEYTAYDMHDHGKKPYAVPVIEGNAQVYGNARVCGGHVLGNAEMKDHTAILDRAVLDGNAFLFNEMRICNDVKFTKPRLIEKMFSLDQFDNRDMEVTAKMKKFLGMVDKEFSDNGEVIKGAYEYAYAVTYSSALIGYPSNNPMVKALREHGLDKMLKAEPKVKEILDGLDKTKSAKKKTERKPSEMGSR